MSKFKNEHQVTVRVRIPKYAIDKRLAPGEYADFDDNSDEFIGCEGYGLTKVGPCTETIPQDVLWKTIGAALFLDTPRGFALVYEGSDDYYHGVLRLNDGSLIELPARAYYRDKMQEDVEGFFNKMCVEDPLLKKESSPLCNPSLFERLLEKDPY